MEKTCSQCNTVKTLEEFHKKKASKDGYQPRCKSCNKQNVLKYYHNNTNQSKDLFKYRASQTKIKMISEINAYKASKGCLFCGEKEPICLDFHHRDPSVKESNVSNLTRQKNFQKLWEEVLKCVVVCSNCHRKLHARLLQLPE